MCLTTPRLDTAIELRDTVVPGFLCKITPAGRMANIGTFTADKDGFTGTFRTLTINVKLVPNDKADTRALPTTACKRLATTLARRGRKLARPVAPMCL